MVRVRIAWTVCLAVLAGCAMPGPDAGDAARRLPAPDDAAARGYLGLAAEATDFALDDIAGEIVIVHRLDMYCALCHRAVPGAAKLYGDLAERGYAERVKMIGLGVRNTALEMGVCRAKFSPPYPVFQRQARDAQRVSRAAPCRPVVRPRRLYARVFGAVAGRYGLLRSDGTAERALVVIDKQGVIRYIDVHDINRCPPLDALIGALAALKSGTEKDNATE
jgi:hypothetical protein